jgi:hypothetical protein
MEPKRFNSKLIAVVCLEGLEGLHRFHEEHDLLDENHREAVENALAYLTEVRDYANRTLLFMFLWSAAGFPHNLLPDPRKRSLQGNPRCIQLNLTPPEAKLVHKALNKSGELLTNADEEKKVLVLASKRIEGQLRKVH